MPLPIGPILGIAARAVATKAAQRGAASAVSRGAISSSQFARGASIAGRVGKIATTVGRGAMLTSAFLGTAAGAAGGSAAPTEADTGPKQGVDTYSDGIY